MRYPKSTQDLHNAKRDVAQFLAHQGLFLAAAAAYEEVGDTVGAQGIVKLWEEANSASAYIPLTQIFKGR